jgi:hypothetical protein
MWPRLFNILCAVICSSFVLAELKGCSQTESSWSSGGRSWGSGSSYSSGSGSGGFHK